MHRNWNLVRTTVALAVCCWMLSWGNAINAQDEASVLVDKPVEEFAAPPVEPASPRDAMPAMPLETPAPAASAPLLTPHVNYRTHIGARRMIRRGGEMPTSVVAKNPADCCLYQIPLCIPCCCTGEPTVASHCGPLDRGVVEYCWSCGFRAKVVFRARGDVVVHYGG